LTVAFCQLLILQRIIDTKKNYHKDVTVICVFYMMSRPLTVTRKRKVVLKLDFMYWTPASYVTANNQNVTTRSYAGHVKPL